MNAFLNGYITCALWSSMDNDDEQGGQPLDENFSIDDVSPETLERMKEDCENFQKDNAAKLFFIYELCDDSRAGHNFWLSRNGHGSGYFDEYFGKNTEIRLTFTELQEAARAWGSFDLYVGDNNLIYAN